MRPMAICTATSTPRNRLSPRPPPRPSRPSRRTVAISVRAANNAGARPESRPAATVVKAAKTRTGVSTSMPRDPRDVVGQDRNEGVRHPRRRGPAPATPPKSDWIRLSVSSWRKRRLRSAPTELRIAISGVLCAPRARSMLAMFAQAMSNTRPTTISRKLMVFWTLPRVRFIIGSAHMPVWALVSGYAAARWAAIAWSSTLASATVTPSASRPTPPNECHERSESSRGRTSGAQSWLVSRPPHGVGNSNSSGMTPTISYGTPLTWIVLPTTSGSPPN